MKKLLLSIMTLLYMTVSSGIAMEIHYCMGKQAGVEFYGSGDDKCGRCGMKESKGGCCSDDHKFYKLEDSHKNISNDLSFTAADIAVISSFPVYEWQLPVITEVPVAVSEDPPDDSGPGACILNCVFRL